jgi:PII-like signaling protein
MKIEGEGQLLRIFIGESDRWEGRPLYEAIVRVARELGLAGTTVLRGVEGFGANSRIHTMKILRLSEDLPIVVEIVDQPDRIARFLPVLDKMVTEGMVTLEKVNVLIYRHGTSGEASQDEEIELENSNPGGPPRHSPQGEFATATDDARTIIEMARQEAAQSHRGFVDSVDILLALIREPAGIAGRALSDLDISSETVEKCLREQVSRETPTDAFLAALESRSLTEADWLGHNHVGTEHLLLALCEIRPSAATDILTRLGGQPRDVCKDVLEILGRHDDWQRWLADHPDM